MPYLPYHSLRLCTIPGAYEPPEGWKERPTPHYSVKRHLNLNDCDAFLIWTSTQVVQKCCFHNQCATLQVCVVRLRLRALVMKTTLLDHLSLGPYKESVTSVQIQIPFHAVGRSFRPSGAHTLLTIRMYAYMYLKITHTCALVQIAPQLSKQNDKAMVHFGR